MSLDPRIYVAGHRGMVGAAIVRQLLADGVPQSHIVTRQFGASHGLDCRSVMPTNLYGPGDNYHPENSHVIPSLVRRFHEAKLNRAPCVALWGTGTPRREFLYGDDIRMRQALTDYPEIERLIEEISGDLSGTFTRTDAPLDSTEAHGGVSEGASEGVSRLLQLIQQQPGLRTPTLASQLNTSVKNIERWLQQLEVQRAH